MKRFLLFLFLALFLSRGITASACTIFTQSDDSLVLAGNNEDFFYSYDSMYWVVNDESKYSRICFGNSTYVQGGMNEKGLFYDGATCPPTQVPHDAGKESLGMDAGEVVLAECATVKEALAFLQNHNISASLGDHLLFADSSGDAAVIEWVENEIRIISAEDNKLVATNFYLSNPDLGWYPCERYDVVSEILSGPGPLSPLEFSNILFSTTQDWGDGGTKYSNVYNLKDLTVYLYERGDFSKAAVINLREELAKLAAGEKSVKNINSLSYQETSSLLGAEVIDYRKTTDNDTGDAESRSIISGSDKEQENGKTEVSQMESSEDREARTENTQSADYPVALYFISVAAIAVIAFSGFAIFRKKRRTKH